MQIREDQMAVFARAIEHRVNTAEAVELARRFPNLVRFVGMPAIEAAVAAATADGEPFGFGSGRARRLFLRWTVLLGIGLVRDPQYAWLRELLERDLGLPPVLRVQVIEWNVWAYQDRAHGVAGELAKAAWARVALLEARHIQAIAADLGAGGLQWMNWLHPEKAKFVDPDARSRLTAAAFSGAAALGLEGTAQVALIGVVMFLFGSEALTSPLHPWIRACVESSGTPDQRCGRLLMQVVDFAKVTGNEVHAQGGV